MNIRGNGGSSADFSVYLDDWKETSHRELKKALCAGDSKAWQFIKIYSIRLFVFRSGSLLIHQVHDLHWDGNEEDELLSRLYIRMIDENKIALYEHKAPLHLWFRYYIRAIIKEEIRKKNAEDIIMVSQNEDDILSVSDNTETDDESERYTFGQKCFGELWRTNSIYAYVLLLRDKAGLSSKTVSELLKHTNDININKIHQRAMESLKKIAAERQD